MKKSVLSLVFLMSTGVAFAGEGKSCKVKDASYKNVELTGTIACADGSAGGDCARVFRVSNKDTEYKVCDKSKVKLAKLSGDSVRVSGKLVSCGEGEELMIEKASKI